MTDETLIQQLLGPEADRLTSFDELVGRGLAVVPALIEALNEETGVPQLTAVLSALHLDDPVAVLGPIAQHPSRIVRGAGLHALGASRDPHAFAILEAALPRNPIGAADALGDLGDPRATAPLLARVQKYVGDGTQLPPSEWLTSDSRCLDLEIVLAVAAALGKLGDHSLAALAIHVVTLRAAKESTAAEHVRVAAAEALAYLTVPGVAAALHAASRAKGDVAAAALRSMLMLGRIDEVEPWIAALSGRNSDLARRCLEAWSGDSLGEEVSTANGRSWWKDRSSRFVGGVCYRLGKPSDPSDLVSIIATDPTTLRTEFQIKTGSPAVRVELGGEAVSPGERAAIDAWWKAHASEYPPGKLFRWGRVFEPGAVDA